MNTDDFDLLYKKLTELDITNEPEQNNKHNNNNNNKNNTYNNLQQLNVANINAQPFNQSPFNPQPFFQRSSFKDPFNLPIELQGGVSEISSRRPSYAAESYTRSNTSTTNWSTNEPSSVIPPLSQQQLQYSFYQQQQQQQQQQHQFPSFFDFQHRRPSQQITFSNSSFYQESNNSNNNSNNNINNNNTSTNNTTTSEIRLENGLILKNEFIIASQDLKILYSKTTKYFEDPNLTNEIISKLNNLLKCSVIQKLIIFIKNINNISYNKLLTLVVNKNGKLDLLSYPNSSNIFLQKGDVVIVDGDRGKDLVMIVEPLIQLNFAILFNFIKKMEHLKSLTILDSNNTKSTSTHSVNQSASNIINYLNEDNEFIITLPTKQVLRFATPNELHKLNKKFLEEKKSFMTCFNKIKELQLNSQLILINVEYQFDFKKLIFYYFANFKRIDFRGLIKELFKIYKTRIWLCAVLPFGEPKLYESDIISMDNLNKGEGLPSEYNITNDLILNFNISNLPDSNYFHSLNLRNLINNLEKDVKGNFYGFGGKDASKEYKDANFNQVNKLNSNGNGHDKNKILSNFNPFGD
ncbi:unnamed protein product [Candida verbasci]|uniref:PSP1 C-terminal domain-containing protein n=1 Tax=Candida verbasci TaxID=1227364 RepID=A0A9W4TUS7_9ASCO|nr:unnamed protein product [Candida verbasci]